LSRLNRLAFACVLAASGCGLFFPSNNNTQGPSALFPVHPIRVDSVGYVTGREKLATLVLPAGKTSLTDATAEVHVAADGSLAWPCTMTGPKTDADTGSIYYVADFTGFTDPGTFYVQAPGLLDDTNMPVRSVNFQIAPDVFRDTLTRAMIGFYAQRCGTAVSITLDGETWSHGICHQQDASQTYLPPVMMNVIKPSKQGWHDAGDYGKYVTNGAFTVGMLLDAWQHFTPTLTGLSLPIPEHGGALPDFLAEVKWELDWLLTTQRDDGAVSHKVTALAFEGFVMPEGDAQPRYFTDIGTSATADFVAVMSQAARIYAAYDQTFADTCKAAALLGYQFLKANPNRIFPDESKFGTGGYQDNSDTGERLWAGAELFETTGDASVLADIETLMWNATAATPALRTKVVNNFDWGDATNLGLFTYLLSKQPGRTQAIVDALTASAIQVADGLAMTASTAAFGRAINGYFWGSNGTVARAAMNLWVANVLSPDPKYLDAIAMQLDHLLGRNIYDRTQMTMVGYHPPLRPHHRPSIADNVSDPWPGLLVGGANSQDSSSSTPAAMTWEDSSDFPELNEVAINWNGAIVYAAAAVTPPPSP
jgi:endoglucanase